MQHLNICMIRFTETLKRWGKNHIHQKINQRATKTSEQSVLFSINIYTFFCKLPVVQAGSLSLNKYRNLATQVCSFINFLAILVTCCFLQITSKKNLHYTFMHQLQIQLLHLPKCPKEILFQLEKMPVYCMFSIPPLKLSLFTISNINYKVMRREFLLIICPLFLRGISQTCSTLTPSAAQLKSPISPSQNWKRQFDV